MRVLGALVSAAIALLGAPSTMSFPKEADLRVWADKTFDGKGWTYGGLVEDGDASFALYTRPGTLNGVILKSLYVRREYLTAVQGGRSTAELYEIDCDRQKFRVEQSTVYGDNNLKGEIRAITDATDWRTLDGPPQLAKAAKAVCDGAEASPTERVASLSAPAAPGPRLPDSEPRKSALRRASPTPSPTPSPPSAPAASPAAAVPLAYLAHAAPPGAAPAEALADRVPAEGEARGGPERSPPAGPPRVPAAPRGGPTVQVAAYGAEGLARQGLSGFRTRFGPDLKDLALDVAPGEGAKGPVFRLVVSGFRDNAAAVAFCEALRPKGGSCFVRREGVSQR